MHVCMPVCVLACMCVCESEREKERERLSQCLMHETALYDSCQLNESCQLYG